MRFIGSKSLMIDNIKKVIDENVLDDSKSLCDIFSGTTSVSRYFKRNYEIISNDIMYFSYVLQMATINNNNIPEFDGLKKIGIDDPLDFLESYNLDDIDFENSKYFISNNYAPSSSCNRMYLTKENANRIDFIRLQIEEWKDKKIIKENEYFYLLACLIEAVPYVSNISGTYGAYLKHWDKRALNILELNRLEVLDNSQKNLAYNKDANKLVKEISGDILYIDPPYNSRQYVPNYHLLETLALYDYPEIKGVTGLRNYDDKKSKYCIKREVKNTFEELIKNAKFKHIIVSYSTDGLMTIKEIEDVLKKYGKNDTYKLYKIPYRKYKSKFKQQKNELYELIFYIQKDIDVKISSKNLNKKKCSIQKYESKHEKKKYIKSPLNYIGGKYKILDQILPLFPDDINTFVDLFTGGLNVGINVNCKRVYSNDINTYVIDILKTFKEKDSEKIVEHIENRIKEFNLSKENEEGFKKFRDYYNNCQTPLDLYTLICFSFNYQFRFNNEHKYNNPFGRNRSQFSKELKKKLLLFIDSLKSKNITFFNDDFEKFDFSMLKSNDLIYCDPPYLITTGSYNDGNRGFKDWNLEEEKKLLNLLDELNNKGLRFALSNVLTHKGKKNDLLIEWSKKYTIHNLNYDYSNSSHNTTKGNSEEVLITNF